MIRNITKVKPKLISSLHIPPPISTSSFFQQNPILHQSNRIMTVGLLSSYSKNVNFKQFYSNNTTTTTTNTTTTVDEINFQKRKPILSLFKKNPSRKIVFKYIPKFRCVLLALFEPLDGTLDERGRINFSTNEYLSIKLNLSDLGQILAFLNSSSENSLKLTKKKFNLQNIENDNNSMISMNSMNSMNSGHYIIFKLDKEPHFTFSISEKVDSIEDEKIIIETKLSTSEITLILEFFRCSIRSGLGFQ